MAGVTNPPDVIGEIMTAVLACASQALTAAERPCARELLAPGALPAFDDCCDGFLYVRIASMFPSGNPFPQQDLRPGNCKPALVGSVLAVGVLRCAAVVDDNGNAPSAVTLTAETLGMTRDASILLSALECCVADMVDVQGSLVEQLVLGTWSPIGPDGGCTGGEWTLTVGHGACGCP